jgi:hypothetical protein
MKNIRYLTALLLILSTALTSCKKDFLDVKPDKTLVVPHTLPDLQALLDNTDYMNLITPYLGEVGSDDFYLLYSSWNVLAAIDAKNAYIWAKDIYGANPTVPDWENRYRQVFYANVVLEQLEKLSDSEKASPDFAREKGSALFYRAFAFYQLAQIFCKPYSSTAGTDLGIPIRLKSDINIKSTRATVEQTYQQILTDLKAAVHLLPVTPSIKTRPSQPAAYALAAKTLLLMQNYGAAKSYADSCLALPVKLLNYNSLNASSSFPFVRFNDEVIFHSRIGSVGAFAASRLIIDSTLYRSYSATDLRKTMFFRLNGVNQTFKGSYDGSATFFTGIATDEIYLLRAECLARTGGVSLAMDDLNELLKTKYQQTGFTHLTASDAQQAIRLILTERRKELVFRGIRWQDLRRLNLDPNFAVKVTRNLNGQVYTLLPNDSRYVLPIPDNVIQISGIQQNER